MNKLRIYQILDVARPGDRASRICDIFILSFIALNVIAVVLETVQSIREVSPAAFWYFEVVSVVIFSVEYLLRLWSCTANPVYANPVTAVM